MALSDVEKLEARKAAIKALAESGEDVPGQITFSSGRDYIQIEVKRRKGFSWGTTKRSSQIRDIRRAERAMLDVVKSLWR